MKDELTATIYSNATHIEQTLTAARVWCEINGYRFHIIYKPHAGAPLWETAVNISVDGKHIWIDNSDSPHLMRVDDMEIDRYYKRSYVAGYDEQAFPVYPLGFNYPLAYHGFSMSRFRSWKKDKVYFFRSFPMLNNLANLSFSRVDYRKMSAPPIDNGGKILFLTRLWNPDNVSNAGKKQARMAMNELRINIVHLLRKHFPGRAVAGIEDTPFARAVCADIIVPKKISGKKNYLNLLKQSDICMATNGLENTPGWRIGEYVAFSKAVLTEPFLVTIPDWEQEVHYNTFDIKEMVSKVDALLYSKRYIQVQEANYAYYRNHLEPVAYFERLITSV